MTRTIYVAAFALSLAGAPALAQAPEHQHPQDAQQVKPSETQKPRAMGGMDAMDDASYLRMMRMHHEHGVKLAKLASEKARRADVKAFAEQAALEQHREIVQLQRIEESLPAGTSGVSAAHPHPAPDSTPSEHPTMKDPGAIEQGMRTGAMSEHGMMSGHGHMDQQAFRKLENASGAEFDEEFLRAMEKHHEMGLQMSRQTARFRSDEVKTFAADVVKKRTEELKRLEALQQQSSPR